jgi:hypothetical protein
MSGTARRSPCCLIMASHGLQPCYAGNEFCEGLE